MSLATYFMHLIFASLPSLFNSDFILYFVPVITLLILFFSLKVMFFESPKLRRVK